MEQRKSDGEVGFPSEFMFVYDIAAPGESLLNVRSLD
jgi:hypothetical protein